MNRLRGWIRLGLVLSAAWVMFICGLAAYEYFTTSSSHDAHWFVTYEPEVPVPNLDLLLVQPRLKIVPFFLAAFMPLVVTWTLVPLIAWAVSWVRAGFKS